jgi:hypothetical protein
MAYIFTGSEGAADRTTSIVAPIVEEFLKGLAVVIVFFIFYKEFDSILDGIIYGGIVGLGFAATENTIYIYRNGYLDGGWGGLFLLAFIRDSWLDARLFHSVHRHWFCDCTHEQKHIIKLNARWLVSV